MNIMPTAVRSADTEEARAAQDRITEARALIDSAETALLEFFDALYANAVPDDILRTDARRLAALAKALWAEAGKRAKGAIRVATLDDGHETVLVGINDDRPFLFDSALQAAIAGGARIRAAIHPIVTIDGVKTSVIALVSDHLSDELRKTLADNLREVFLQGAVAVRDWQAMLTRIREARDRLAAHPPHGVDVNEDLAFLDWLANNHFTLLGARDYTLVKDGAHGRLEPAKDSGLGVLADEHARVIRAGGERQGLSGDVREWLDSADPLIITKSFRRSVVHRRAHMDYIGVKTYDAEGRFNGEHRFVGLFTSTAYSAQPRAIPLLRKKIENVMHRAGMAPASHDGKALSHILDTFPRDEMFQVSEDELYEIALGILRLGGLPRLKLFLRFDRFDRFVSAILLAPRDHINAKVRDQIHELLAKALHGRTSAYDVAIDDSPLVRLHFIIGRDDTALPAIDVKALEREIALLIETWDDAFIKALCAAFGRNEGFAKASARAPQFSPGYREMFPPHEGARDLGVLEELSASKGLKLRARVWRKEGDAASALRMKLYVLGEVFPLSSSLPVFESLG